MIGLTTDRVRAVMTNQAHDVVTGEEFDRWLEGVVARAEKRTREQVAQEIETERVRLYGADNLPLDQQARQEQSLCYAKARDIARGGTK